MKQQIIKKIKMKDTTQSSVGNLENKEAFSLIRKKPRIIRMEDLRVSIKDTTGDIIEEISFPFKQFEFSKYSAQIIDLDPLETLDLTSWDVNSIMIINQSSNVDQSMIEISQEGSSPIVFYFCDYFMTKTSTDITSVKFQNLSENYPQTIKVLLFK